MFEEVSSRKVLVQIILLSVEKFRNSADKFSETFSNVICF